jgi:hypothetical protein
MQSLQVDSNEYELQRAIIIDARLKLSHTLSMLQAILMAACQADEPFNLTFLGDQYMLLLPQ